MKVGAFMTFNYFAFLSPFTVSPSFYDIHLKLCALLPTFYLVFGFFSKTEIIQLFFLLLLYKNYFNNFNFTMFINNAICCYIYFVTCVLTIKQGLVITETKTNVIESKLTENRINQDFFTLG